MGCTSSAPNVSEAYANSADKTIQFSEDGDKNEKVVTIQKNEKVFKIQNELTDQCDTSIKSSELGRTNSLLTNDSTKLEINEDDKIIVDGAIGHNDVNSSQEKISTLKEIGDQVVISNSMLHKQLSIKASSSSHQSTDDVTDTEKQTESKELSLIEMSHNEFISEEEPKNQEITSPSQSECSRATRWEALADMAAELPPSLTVDPISGHIYALSK